MKGHGCMLCAAKNRGINQRLSNKEFIEIAINKHGDFYNYSSINYIDWITKIKIICPIHGEFEQTPSSHLQGCGCQKCAYIYPVKENKWLNYLNVPNDKYHRQVKLIVNDKIYVVDGYDAKSNTIYEFYGDFWHGNPNIYNPNDINPVSNKTFGELYNKTIKRELNIKTCGYNLVTIWENNFKK